MKSRISILSLCLLSLTLACKKKENQPDGNSSATKIAPDGFNFATTRPVTVNIQLLAPDNSPISGVPVSLYNAGIALQDDGSAPAGTALFTGISDQSGYVKTTLNLPTNIDTVFIDPKYTGLIRNVKAFVSGTTLNALIGGPDGIGGNIAKFAMPGSGHTPAHHGGHFTLSTNYISMGNIEGNGRPKYRESQPAFISSTLLANINASLPENIALETTHPQYLSGSATGTINVTGTSDVYITFVSEGSSRTNSLGYYTYPTGTPPQQPTDINDIYLVLPNASGKGSGGGMHSGDKIKLGTFNAGTSIGFVLFVDGWTGNGKGTVNTAVQQYFTNDNLNPETNTQYKRHSVLLYDAANALFVTGFEDQPRPAGDQDFNDVVFYTSSNPASAISSSGVQLIAQPGDADGDGVSDVLDQYSQDASRAYDNYYPAKNSYGTLAFEDFWPQTGDYDMNDLVVNYRYKFVSNASNNIVEIYGDYAVKGAGASFQNGFGVQFPFSPGLVKTVTGQKLNAGYIATSGNGVEAGQTKAVIIPFDNHQNLINNLGGAYFINTKTEMPKVTGDTAHVYLQFNSPVSISTMGAAPFNPFLISNMRRKYEIHLPGQAPTDLADAKLLGTDEDASVPLLGIYYISKDNWPWAINFSGAFTYPVEGVKISDAYLHFLHWAGSSGNTYKDWYTNTGGGYVNTPGLYTK